MLDLLNAIPSGVLAVNPGLHEPIQTSTSLTTATTSEDVLTLGSMTRSSNAAALDGVLETMHALARLGGAEIDVRRSYPPWEPDLESALLATARRTQLRLFGSEPDPRRSSTVDSSAPSSVRGCRASRCSRSGRR